MDIPSPPRLRPSPPLQYRPSGVAAGLTPLLRDASALLAGGGIPHELSADLVEARWRKLCWNVPFNSLTALQVRNRLCLQPAVSEARRTFSIAPEGPLFSILLPSPSDPPQPLNPFGSLLQGVSTDVIMASPTSRADARAIMGEVQAGCQAATGRAIPDDFLDHMIEASSSLGPWPACALASACLWPRAYVIPDDFLDHIIEASSVGPWPACGLQVGLPVAC